MHIDRVVSDRDSGPLLIERAGDVQSIGDALDTEAGGGPCDHVALDHAASASAHADADVADVHDNVSANHHVVKILTAPRIIVARVDLDPVTATATGSLTLNDLVALDHETFSVAMGHDDATGALSAIDRSVRDRVSSQRAVNDTHEIYGVVEY